MAYVRELRALRQQLGVEARVSFVFETGPDPDVPELIGPVVVGDLFRVSDVMFMPSHREGFGMPVLEAGLVGIPVVCAGVPAASEIGMNDVIVFDPCEDPARVAGQILDRAASSPTYWLRRRVRQHYTWEALFRTEIEPMINSQQEPIR